MSDPEILITTKLLDSCMEGLEKAFTCHRLFEAADQDAMLAELGPRIRGVAGNGGTPHAAATLDKLPNLEMFSAFGVGYDGIDVEYCRGRGIRVTNTPEVLNDAMAEITLGLIIALARKIPQADVYTRAGKWEEANFPLQAELTGKTIGIVGLGRIGKEVARRAQAFKMQVVYHGRNRQEFEPYPYYGDLKAMARDVDWLLSIVPGGAETEKMYDASVFEALGPEGFFVNVGRGSSVDEPAMIEALQKGTIAGAALDVFADEPRVPQALRDLDNVVLSPHQGSATHKTRWMMGDLVVRNMKAYFDGKPVLTPVA